MNPRTNFIRNAVSALMVAGCLLPSSTAFAQAAAAAEDVQFLTRGPVHEAFAESVTFDPVAGIVVSVQPPEPIEELPPEQQPEGDNVTWISGYWAWDDDQKDFIWISGIWRNLPPGRQWVPGYWNGIEGGQSQWTSGYWADATVTEVSYVSTAPPHNIDAGPNVEAPSADHGWVPGNWMWVDDRYAWRPGYWAPQRVNWTWVPSRYNWSRRGYIYVDGYWDYSVARRGVLFAPVSFHRNVYSRPDYYYTPSIVVALSVFSSHLFIRPQSGHYYFGDYYAPRYRDAGYHASYSWSSGRHGYDPIYAYDRWEHRGDQQWERRRHDDFNYFRDHEEARPAHTWAAMRDYREDRFNDGRNRSYATPFAGYTQDTRSGQRFRTLDNDRRKQFVSQRQEVRNFSQERRQMESRANVAADGARKTSSREKLTRSPIIGREAERFAKNEAPPKRPEARGNQARRSPATQNNPQAARKEEARNPGKRQDGNQANDRRKDRGVTPRDEDARNNGKAAAPGQNRDAKPGDNAKNPKSSGETARREGGSANGSNKPKGPEREAKPKAEARPDTDRKNPAVPQREVKPNPQIRDTPKRDEQPKAQERPTPERKPQATPQRETPSREVKPPAQNRPSPERKPQAAPQRETPNREVKPAAQNRPSPERKPQAAPQRETPGRNVKPAAQNRPSPERKPQAAPKRETQQPQARPMPERKPQAAPQRESRPNPQARPAPQRQTPATPQRKGPSEEKKKSDEEETSDKKRKDSR